MRPQLHLPAPALPACVSSPDLQAALKMLLAAHDLAIDVDRDPWQFAVEIDCLHGENLTNNDLRWLICKGWVEHAVERVPGVNGSRSFHRFGKLVLSRRSCFVLTPLGVPFARQGLTLPATDLMKEASATPEGRRIDQPDSPHWDAQQHTLYWQGQPVKHFKREAPFQEAVLETFQACNWAGYVMVKLPKHEGVSPKDRLRETIKNLNQSCGKKLHFTQEGNGTRVGWQALARLSK